MDGKGIGDHKCMGTVGGRVGEFMLEGTQEGIIYGDVTSGRQEGGGGWFTWGIVNW